MAPKVPQRYSFLWDGSHIASADMSKGADGTAGDGGANTSSPAPAIPSTYLACTFPQNPEVIHTIQHEYTCLQPNSTPCPHSNFLKGVKWSPDGACMLTASDDGWMRIFDLPPDCLTCPAPLLNMHDDDGQASTEASGQVPSRPAPWQPSHPDTLGAALRVQEGETVYDYAWYPCMSALDPQSCCFATSSRAHPVHLWDAGTGDLRATYRGYSDVDEVTAAFSLAFSPDGSQIYAGYSKWILAFDITRPGRDSRRIPCTVKGPGSYTAKLPGMVSCLAFAHDSSCLAAGTYSQHIGIFDPRIPEMQLVLQGHKGGLTQLLFTHDGHYLLSGARQDPDLICWDLRGGTTSSMGDAGGVVYRMQRDTVTTNQRIGFGLEPCGRHLLTGGCNGAVRVFDLQTGQQVDEFAVAEDTVNGCDVHPALNLLAVATGHRRYAVVDDADDGEEDSTISLDTSASQAQVHACTASTHSELRKPSNAVRILRLQHQLVQVHSADLADGAMHA